MKLEVKPTEEEMIKDLFKWCDKINALMYQSAEGVRGLQATKMMLIKRQMNEWEKEFIKRNGKREYDLLSKAVDDFIEEFAGNIVIEGGENE